MRFFRHFAAVAATVAVVVGLGLLWAHASGGGPGTALRRVPPRAVMLRRAAVRDGVIRINSDNGFDFADTSDLIRTCEIEAVLAAGVITVSVIRRRRRRRQRAATASA